jgi:hypothetical protein
MPIALKPDTIQESSLCREIWHDKFEVKIYRAWCAASRAVFIGRLVYRDRQSIDAQHPRQIFKVGSHRPPPFLLGLVRVAR